MAHDPAVPVEHALGVVLRIGMGVLVACQRLADVIPPGHGATLRRTLDANPAADEILDTMLKGRAEVGDLVLAGGALGELVDVAVSDYGYESYKVRFVEGPAFLGQSADWFIAQHVRVLLSLDGIKEMISAQVAAGSLPQEQADMLLRLPDDQLRDHFKASSVLMWNAGMREAIMDPNRPPRHKTPSLTRTVLSRI